MDSDTHNHTYTAPLGHRVALVVQDSVGVCEDRLTVYDGTSTSDPKILDKCSGYTGLTISTGNQLYFQFKNQRVDNNVSSTIGYSLRYFGFDPYGNPDPAQTFFSSDLYGSLYPNTFPGTYDATADIFWIVKAPCMSYLITGALFFADFNNCNDQLILRDGSATTSAELVTYCTDLTQNPDQSDFNTTQQYLYVQLNATSNGSYHGFALKYRWIPNLTDAERTASIDIGPIVGGSVGALVLIAVIAGVVVLYKKGYRITRPGNKGDKYSASVYENDFESDGHNPPNEDHQAGAESLDESPADTTVAGTGPGPIYEEVDENIQAGAESQDERIAASYEMLERSPSENRTYDELRLADPPDYENTIS